MTVVLVESAARGWLRLDRLAGIRTFATMQSDSAWAVAQHPAELRRDGVTVSRVEVGAEKACIARFQTEYHPGELTAIAIRDGKEAGRSTLRTRGERVGLSLAADRTELRADGTDLAYVAVELADDEGILATDLIAAVSVQIEGPGSLAGFASAQPDPTEEFGAATRTTHDGRALAIIRPTGPGTITVRATAAGLDPKEVHLVAN